MRYIKPVDKRGPSLLLIIDFSKEYEREEMLHTKFDVTVTNNTGNLRY
jgi:hypothetical protein